MEVACAFVCRSRREAVAVFFTESHANDFRGFVAQPRESHSISCLLRLHVLCISMAAFYLLFARSSIQLYDFV